MLKGAGWVGVGGWGGRWGVQVCRWWLLGGTRSHLVLSGEEAEEAVEAVETSGGWGAVPKGPRGTVCNRPRSGMGVRKVGVCGGNSRSLARPSLTCFGLWNELPPSHRLQRYCHLTGLA